MFDNWMEECPCCSVFLNILSFSCFVVTMWAVGDKTERDGLAPRDIAALPAVLFLLLYAFYLLECYRSATRRCLSIVKKESAMTFIDSIRRRPPVILFKATGWHYEKKQRAIPYRDGRGKLRERIETYQERVVTFDETEAFSTSFGTKSFCHCLRK
ncbi:transmembrane protein 151 homolog isoform X2 [Orbicella faveolata]|uniref:transmembrane protein 151 homolog isoform X2 n=1 Tax=Orbicella faveolata TaxID=48498 RepID=UPI0009E2D69E|nr:transmembrane protein 151 homolog isoform X2 [Orbicella faveolata]